jgi:hypothetical protein
MPKPGKITPSKASAKTFRSKLHEGRIERKSTKKQKRFKHRITDHLVHGLLIFTSVFMAFWLSERRETQKNLRVAENALINVATEMRYNHMQMVNTFNYHYTILQNIDSTQNVDPEMTDDAKATLIQGYQGLALPLLRSSAYASIINSGILKDVPLETANAIARVYNFQNILERLDDNIISVASQDANFNSIERIRFLFTIYSEILPELMAQYQFFGKKYIEPYGYTLKLDEGVLKDKVEKYMN